MTTMLIDDSRAGWLVAAAPGATLLIAEGAAEPSELLAATGSADPVARVLELVMRAGLASAPAFALIVADGGRVRVILRGEPLVEVVATAPVSITAADTTTWVERVVDGATAVTVSTGGDGGRALPLVQGVVAGCGFKASLDAATGGLVTAPVPTIDVAEQQPEPAPVPKPTAPVLASPDPATLVDPVLESESPIERTLVELPTDGEAEAETPAPETETETEAEDDNEDGYDHLFEATIVRDIESAAVRPDDPDADLATPAAAPDAFHDGMTVMSGDLQQLRDHTPTAPEIASPTAPSMWIQLPSGEREDLAQTLLIGRSPSAAKVSGGAMPRLVALSGDQDISRNHVRIALEGDTVVVTDLHSKNGTAIELPGKSPQQLRSGEPTAVITGTVIDLGGGVRLSVGEDSGAGSGAED